MERPCTTSGLEYLSTHATVCYNEGEKTLCMSSSSGKYGIFNCITLYAAPFYLFNVLHIAIYSYDLLGVEFKTSVDYVSFPGDLYSTLDLL